MSARPELSRREFLATGASAGAGLVIAFYLPPAAADLGAAADGSAAPFTPNAWITIDAQGGVTLTLDKSEMGQGVHTGMAMILAEELELEWSAVRLAPVPENPAAWHRRMSTGGSTSIRGTWPALRKAGAQGRAMLIGGAAETWGVTPAVCRAERGTVLHEASGRRLPYGRLVDRAAALPVPDDPPLKDPKDFRLLGTRARRLDTPVKVNGAAQFGIDVRVPGMLVASIARSPVFGGTVKRVDAAKARAVPGVRHVIELPGHTAPSTNGEWQTRTESGVAVVAGTYWQAVQGRRALAVQWDDGPSASWSSAGISATLARLAEQSGVVART
ncbi:MAG: molybdopterin cofactor-binding domain-containing protein, partial [Gemmatimonadales bacterium]